MKVIIKFCWLAIAIAIFNPCFAVDTAPEGWVVESPRDEIRPEFFYQADGGPNGAGCFVIASKKQSEDMGRWIHTVPVVGGRHYSFHALRKTKGVDIPRRKTLVRITWQDDNGDLVKMASGVHLSHRTAQRQLSKAVSADISPEEEEKRVLAKTPWNMIARCEYPVDGSINDKGWTKVEGVYRVPPDATQARIELCLRWSPGGEVRWSNVSLEEVAPPTSRKVRLATINLNTRTKGEQKTALDSCRLFADLIAEAARQNADIVCLPEEVTYLWTEKEMEDVAEPIPGECSDYFGELARKHDLYIVAGLVERDGPHIFNTAALIGPDGSVVGKYRKVCLTRDEAVDGYTSGRDFPVFKTRFGKVGIMICWDLTFPEAARSLSNNGAEVIAMPIAGGSPMLARARAIENQIYLITSSNGGLECGIFGYDGKLLGEATDPEGSVCVVEVDLSDRKYWYFLGDLKSHIPRIRP